MQKGRAKTSCDTEGLIAYPVKEAARRLCVKPDTLRGLIERGAIKAFRAGPRLTRVTHKAIEEFIEKHTLPTAREVTA
jgi:excisionase family DNA binding protein